jgi:putative addiction module killer protein
MYPHGYTFLVIEVLQTEHFRKWIDRLRDRGARARILARIIAVEEGHFDDWKAIDRTVSELRVHAGPGYRVYFTRRGNTLVILLAGGEKGSQRRDIDVAKKLAAELRDV